MICGKQIFNSRTEASEALRGSNRNNRKGATKKNRLCTTYFCTECNGWHLSSKERQTHHKKPHKTEEMNLGEKQRRKSKQPNQGVLVIRNFTSRPL